MYLDLSIEGIRKVRTQLSGEGKCDQKRTSVVLGTTGFCLNAYKWGGGNYFGLLPPMYFMDSLILA